MEWFWTIAGVLAALLDAIASKSAAKDTALVLGFFELAHHARKPGKALLTVLLQPLLVYIWGIHLELKVQGIQMIAY